ncbi:MAG: hypothetical protein A3I60_02360 [Sulfuricurvum sp. RIFCSPLOWO2_02_FULL_43_45]|nr:MAG: hypothetical protein A3I60_02360 [Sulfuricurvum sp. RIFCSPLOWO2_02_FULL_43_45]
MKYLVLAQCRESSQYNDFIGKFYHFSKKELDLKFFTEEVSFIYYEPKKCGEAVYFGCGKIKKPPFADKREEGYYFVEIEEYKEFKTPVPGPREPAPYYNAQNAVRNISQETYEDICLDGSVILNFTADSHLVEILGEQLIGSEKVGILELIKNAYDAHATYCKVIIERIPTLQDIHESLYTYNGFEGPVIVIEDNGDGMDWRAIEQGWLRPASRMKTDVKAKIKAERDKAVEEGKLGTFDSLVKELKKAHKGRIPLGEKGVGRFATQRLGKKLLLKSKTKDKEYEYVLEIDWSEFLPKDGKSIALHDIGVSLSKQQPSRDYGIKNSGTQLIIYGGKEGFDWDRESIEDLNTAILKLNAPNINIKKKVDILKEYDTESFEAFLFCPQIPELPNTTPDHDIAPIFEFSGLVDEQGLLDYELNFKPPYSVPIPEETEEDKTYNLKSNNISYWKNSGVIRNPECGAFYIHLKIWYRSKPWIDGPNAKNLMDYLDDFGGITIYRDGINVFPAEKGKESDWLELSREQIKQSFRMSYYHMIGTLELDQTENFDLTDKTNREGMIENQAFKDLKVLLRTIIKNIIEKNYIAKRDEYQEKTAAVIREPRVLANYARQGADIVGSLKDKYPYEEDPYDLLKSLGEEDRKGKIINLERSLKNLKDSLEVIEESQNLLTEHAGFGLAIASSIHELAKIASNFYNGISAIAKTGMDEARINRLIDASLSMKAEIKRLTPLRAIRNERRAEFKISEAIDYIYSIFTEMLKEKNIKTEITYQDDFQLYTRFGAVCQILANLISNSMYWVETVENTEKIIKISISDRTVTVADSGPGVHPSIAPYLFKPGYSMKVPQSGLGLYISKYYMQDMGGDLYLVDKRHELPGINGAQFVLNFKKTPMSKEKA